MHRTTRKPGVRATRPPTRMPLAAAIHLAFGSMLFAGAAMAQQADKPKDSEAPALDTITVTSQKRSENVQKVPISIQAISSQQLERQDVKSFNDYVAMIPSLSFGTAGGGVFSGPGFVQVYMRGVASGGDGNHSGSQPSVGMYLDEQPITTIQGALDIHMYDIERVEALAGPQGTLYGASSQSGTVRIITRKPDPSGYSAGYAVEANAIDGGGVGHVVEGFTNIPLKENTAAIRLVGWEKHDAGYVDNVHGTRTFPTSGDVFDNANRAENNYNDADTWGLRAALKVDLNDNWTISPMLIAQHQKAYGSTGYDPKVGDLEVTHFFPEQSDDRWAQAALTAEGKIGNFDLVYAFSHLKRDVDSDSDYNDYGYWYDTLTSYGQYFTDDGGNFISPAQYIHAKDGYRKTSHELRITSPADRRFRFVTGLFWQQQSHDIFQRYKVDRLASALEVPGWSDTIWLTAQKRIDRDEALFGEVSFDFTDKLTATAGARFFRAHNSLKGFFGYGAGFSGSTGEAACFSTERFHGAPCVNLDKTASERDHLGRLNLTYKLDDKRLVYLTWSQGYRPGGINRRGTLPPYTSDFLTNYEFGWKTTLFDNRLRFNGAIFREDWKDFQFSYLGANGLTEIRNANQARVSGIEVDMNWAATYNLSISGGAAYYNAKLTADYCAKNGADGKPLPECYLPIDNDPLTPDPPDRALSGTRLPITPRLKSNLSARYSFDVGQGEVYWQTTWSYLGSRTTDLRERQQQRMGGLGAYSTIDLAAGYHRNNWTLDVFLRNLFDQRGQQARFAQCATLTCGYQPYTVVTQPRTFGVRFSQNF